MSREKLKKMNFLYFSPFCLQGEHLCLFFKKFKITPRRISVSFFDTLPFSPANLGASLSHVSASYLFSYFLLITYRFLSNTVEI